MKNKKVGIIGAGNVGATLAFSLANKNICSEIVLKDLRKRMENGRNAEKTLVPAKFESYKALCCSGSIPVSNPNGVLVVDDFINYFSTDYVELNDKETDEPIMTIHKKDINDKIELNDSD